MSCKYHFRRFGEKGADWDTIRAEAEGCAECQIEDAFQRGHGQWNLTIDPFQPWGVHIDLTCKHHPNLTWNTKNIDHIGARTIFRQQHEECSCPVSDLIVKR